MVKPVFFAPCGPVRKDEFVPLSAFCLDNDPVAKVIGHLSEVITNGEDFAPSLAKRSGEDSYHVAVRRSGEDSYHVAVRRSGEDFGLFAGTTNDGGFDHALYRAVKLSGDFVAKFVEKKIAASGETNENHEDAPNAPPHLERYHDC